MNGKVYVVVCSLLLTLSGCASAKHLEQGDEVSNSYFSIVWNTASWDFSRSSDEYYVTMEKGDWGDGKGHDSQGINISIKAPSYFKGKKYWDDFAYIDISSESFQARPEYMLKDGSEIFFNRNADFRNISRSSSGAPKLLALGGYYKRAYNKKWQKITYLEGLKCIDVTYLSSFDNSKKYRIYCGYYDKDKGKRILSVRFEYKNAVADSKDSTFRKISESGEIPHVQPIENLVKQAAMQVISTIRIKNINHDRMEREGLMHYDRKFEMSPY